MIAIRKLGFKNLSREKQRHVPVSVPLLVSAAVMDLPAKAHSTFLNHQWYSSKDSEVAITV
jgi:hypothetical protein